MDIQKQITGITFADGIRYDYTLEVRGEYSQDRIQSAVEKCAVMRRTRHTVDCVHFHYTLSEMLSMSGRSETWLHTRCVAGLEKWRKCNRVKECGACTIDGSMKPFFAGDRYPCRSGVNQCEGRTRDMRKKDCKECPGF